MKILSNQHKEQLHELLLQYVPIEKIINRIVQEGGQVLLVGGAVRDLLLDLPVKDIDIEVHNMSMEILASVLKEFGVVDYVGKSFGVLRMQGLDIDWSLPRKDSIGRKPIVHIDPKMSIEDAFRRRDLTINAMGIDLMSYELLDPFEGFNDLQRKILRATDSALFTEDPLRFYRVMQFIGRFEMQPDEELNDICKTMDISKVSRERIEAEFEKLLLRSKRPSLGIRWLKQIGRLQEVLPELFATIGIQQSPIWHPEGNVFEHTMQAVDAVAMAMDYNSDAEKLILLYAALCHDLGKSEATEFMEERWRSYNHDNIGVPIAKKMLKRITKNKDLIEAVIRLVKYHMRPITYTRQRARPGTYKRLALNLSPFANLAMLIKLAYADRLGRNGKSSIPLTKEVANIADVIEFENKVKELDILEQKEEPILYGRDFLDVAKPGPALGKLVKKAYEIQLTKGVKDKEMLKRLVLKDKT